MDTGLDRAFNFYCISLIEIKYDIAKNTGFINEIIGTLTAVFTKYRIRLSNPEIANVENFLAVASQFVYRYIIHMMFGKDIRKKLVGLNGGFCHFKGVSNKTILNGRRNQIE